MIYGLNMNDSLQYQLFNQIQSNTYDANNMREQMLQQQADYNNFRQRMNETAMAQSQTLNQSLYSSVRPALGSFVSGQMGGVYSGLGITPAMQQSFSQNVMPAMSSIGQNIHNSMTLPTAMFNAVGSIAPAALTFEQRQALANSLSYNTVGVANRAIGGVGAVAGAGLGIAAGATILKNMPWTQALGIGAAYMGAKALLTSPTVASLTGWGNVNPGLFNPVNHISEELQESRDWHTYLSNESYRFMSVLSGRTPSGQGLGRSEVHKWSRNIRGLDSKFGISDAEVGDLIKSSVDNNLLTNIKDYEDFEAKLSKQVKYMKSASKILNKSFSEITDMVGEFKRAGISVENFDMKAAELKSYASLLGKNIDAVKDFMLESTKLYTSGTTLSASTTFAQTGNQLSLLKVLQDKATGAGASGQSIVNLINNLGGVEGSQQALRGAFQSMFSSADAIALLGQFYTPNASGGFTLNQQALNSAYSRVRGGSLSFDQLMTSGSSYLNGTLSNSQLRNLQNTRMDLFLNQDENAINQMIGLMAYSRKGQYPFVSSTMEETLTSLYKNQGMTSPMAKLLTNYMDTYNTYGNYIQLSQMSSTMLQRGSAYKQVLNESRKRGWRDITTSWADAMANTLAIGPAETLSDTLENIMGMRAGITSYDYEKNPYSGGLGFSWETGGNALSSFTSRMNAIRQLNAFTSSYGAGALAGSSYVNYDDYTFAGKNPLSRLSPFGGLNWANARGLFSGFGANNSISWRVGNQSLFGIAQQDQATLEANSGNYLANYINSGAYYSNRAYASTASVSNLINSTSAAVPYENIFQQAASTYGINANYLKALAQIESNYNANAPGGGIMQISSVHNAAGFNPADPQQNIFKGAQIFKDYVERFGGNVNLGAIAYNAGPNALVNAMKSAGYNPSTMSQAQLMSFDPGIAIPYLPNSINRAYLSRFTNALSGMGIDTAGMSVSTSRTRNIFESSLSLNAANQVLSNASLSGVNLTSQDINSIRANAGWTTKMVNEQVSPISMNVDALVGSANDMVTVANYARSRGMRSATITAENSAAFIESLSRSDASSLNSTEIQTQITKLKQYLKDFSGDIDDSIREIVNKAINTLEAHKPSKSVSYEYSVNQDLLTAIDSVTSNGRNVAFGLNITPTASDIANKLGPTNIRDMLQTGWYGFGNSFATLLKTPLTGVSMGQLGSLVGAYQKLRQDSMPYLTGDAASQSYMSALDQAKERVGAYVDKFFIASKQGILASNSVVDQQYATSNLENLRSGVTSQEQLAKQAMAAGKITEANEHYGEMQKSAVDLAKSMATQTDAVNKGLFSNFSADDLQVNKALKFLDNQLEVELAKTDTYDPAAVRKLQLERQSVVQFNDVAKSGNLNTIQDIGLSTFNNAIWNIRNSGYEQVTGILGNKYYMNAIDRYYAINEAGQNILDPSRPATQARNSINGSNMMNLVANGGYTSTYNSMLSKMGAGTFSNADYLNLAKTAASGGSSSYAAKQMLRSYEAGIAGGMTGKNLVQNVSDSMDTMKGQIIDMTNKATVSLAGLGLEDISTLVSGGSINLDGQNVNASMLNLSAGGLYNAIKSNKSSLDNKVSALAQSVTSNLYQNFEGQEKVQAMELVAAGASNDRMRGFINSSSAGNLAKQRALEYIDSGSYYAYQIDTKKTVENKKALDDATKLLGLDTKGNIAARASSLDIMTAMMADLSDVAGLVSDSGTAGDIGKLIAQQSDAFTKAKIGAYSDPNQAREEFKKGLLDTLNQISQKSAVPEDVIAQRLADSNIQRIGKISLSGLEGEELTTAQAELDKIKQEFSDGTKDLSSYITAMQDEQEFLQKYADFVKKTDIVGNAETATKNLTDSVKLYYDAVDNISKSTNERVSKLENAMGMGPSPVMTWFSNFFGFGR